MVNHKSRGEVKLKSNSCALAFCPRKTKHISTTISTAAPLPTINEVERWNTEEPIEFLSGQNLKLAENHIKVLRKRDIDFLEELNQEDLEKWKIPGRLAKRVIGLFNKIKGKA